MSTRPKWSCAAVAALVAVSGGGCGKGGNDKSGRDPAGMATPAPPRASPEAARRARPGGESTARKAEPGSRPATRRVPAAAPARKAPPPVATVPAPGWPVWQRLAKPGPHGTAVAASERAALGGSRFAAILRTAPGKDPTTQRLELVILEKQGEAWRLVHRRVVLKEGLAPDGTPNAARLMVEDVDADGRHEAVVRYTAKAIVCPVGEVVHRYLEIWRLEEPPRVVLRAELDRALASPWSLTGRERFRDVDDDGHPDVVIRFLTKEQKKPGDEWHPVTYFHVYRYDPQTDGYGPYTLPGKRCETPVIQNDRLQDPIAVAKPCNPG